MKKIVLAVITLLSLTACVTDREENISNPNVQNVKSFNKNGFSQKNDFDKRDTITVKGVSEQSNFIINDGGDPTTITPPRR
ncbi:hypothetical protein U9K52_08765 [Chryseobacterium sp. MHB01]|uniref:hypothetical protein n=1 Tax=Chryseobacterium sp. MHB01 TaxID=3109433 RepID=UPI002AFFDF87|nr:hypothetical protein [Chryseobacterium sp. MHB01]MEA1848999.1 hypothetical protein [Chryseobacterium sp. MHB01]